MQAIVAWLSFLLQPVSHNTPASLSVSGRTVSQRIGGINHKPSTIYLFDGYNKDRDHLVIPKLVQMGYEGGILPGFTVHIMLFDTNIHVHTLVHIHLISVGLARLTQQHR